MRSEPRLRLGRAPSTEPTPRTGPTPPTEPSAPIAWCSPCHATAGDPVVTAAGCW